MKKLKVGVIGAGSWAVASHIPHLASRPEVELVVVNRLEADVAQRIKAQFGFRYATTNYEEVLQHDLDVVLVSSPAALHYEHTLAALEAGAHVLCEKPFTLTATHAWHLVETANKNDRHLLLAFGWNYKTMLIRAKQIMEEQGVGRIESVMVHMASPIRGLLQSTGAYHGAAGAYHPDPATWTNPQLSGGGFAPAQLSHALGLSLWLTDLRGEEVYARTYANSSLELHDAYSILYANGAIGAVFGASNPYGAAKHQLEVRIFGDRGQLIVDVEREHVWWFRSEEEQIRLDVQDNEGAYDCRGPVHTIVDLALGKQAVNRSAGELGARVVEIVETAYRSAASGKSEKIIR